MGVIGLLPQENSVTSGDDLLMTFPWELRGGMPSTMERSQPGSEFGLILLTNAACELRTKLWKRNKQTR